VNVLELVVPADIGANIRLDQYCTSSMPGVTRSRLKNGLKSLTINGKPAKLSRPVKAGDMVVLEWSDPVPTDIHPEPIPLEILYEDENVTVVNKKQGMVTHPAAGNWTGTLVNALLWHWNKKAGNDHRPGIVHRLDKDTSGIIITARNPETESLLQNSFKNRKVRKIYAAILHGIPKKKSGIVETRIVRDSGNRKRFTCTDDIHKGKYAKTAWHVVKTIGPYSLVLFKLYTGRTHQIRVHAKYLGCPILGDPIYGKKDPNFPKATLMLHARSLTIKIPGKKEPMRFIAPIPGRFKRILKLIRELYE